MTPRKKSLWDLSINFLETGPIRAMVEEEYCNALEKILAGYGHHLSESAAIVLHDRVLASVFDRIGDLLEFHPEGSVECREPAAVRVLIDTVLIGHWDEVFPQKKATSESIRGIPLLGNFLPLQETR